MPKPADTQFVDATQIIEQYGASRSRISEWHRDRATTGFPAVHHAEGRKQLWDTDQVAAWFTERDTAAGQARQLPAAVLKADPDELLTTPQVAELLGYKRVSTIHKYLDNQPGYFPEPDVTERVVSGQPGHPAEMQWRRGTIIEWKAGRPGKGKRTGSVRKAPVLPEVPVDGDPHELLAAPQAAALLGYSSANSFSSALSQGLLPDLDEPDAMKSGVRGGPRRMWKRSTILAARRR